jgi:hypothetical protein
MCSKTSPNLTELCSLGASLCDICKTGFSSASGYTACLRLDLTVTISAELQLSAQEFDLKKQKFVDVVVSLVQLHQNTVTVEYDFRYLSNYPLLVSCTVVMFSSWLPIACINLNSKSLFRTQLIAGGFSSLNLGNIDIDASSAALCARLKLEKVSQNIQVSSQTPAVTSATPVSANLSIICEPGKFLSNNKCEPCDRGSFSAGLSILHCDLCPENYYSPVVAASACITCANGKESSQGASQCYDQDYQKEANLAAIIGGVIGGLVGVIGSVVSIYVCVQQKNKP